MENLERKLDNAVRELTEVVRDVQYIRGFIEEDRQEFKAHIIESRAYREKVLRLENIRKDMDKHENADNLRFGVLFLLIAGVFVTVISPAVINILKAIQG